MPGLTPSLPVFMFSVLFTLYLIWHDLFHPFNLNPSCKTPIRRCLLPAGEWVHIRRPCGKSTWHSWDQSACATTSWQAPLWLLLLKRNQNFPQSLGYAAQSTQLRTGCVIYHILPQPLMSLDVTQKIPWEQEPGPCFHLIYRRLFLHAHWWSL